MQTTVTNGEITTVFDVAEFNVNVGESARIDVNEAVNYIKTGQAEVQETVDEGIADFNQNASEKTAEFNSNATNKNTAFNENASAKTADFNSNASAKTGDFNTNATSKTNTFNQNATDKTTAFNNNASEKTTAFNDNYTEKKAVIDSQVELAKDWATKTDGKVDGEDYSAKYYAQSILPIASDITTVSGIASDVTTVSSISSDVTSVASNSADISAVASDLTNIGNVASDLTNIDSVAGNIANVNAVASNATNINAVNSNKTNIDAVAGNASNINTVAGISSDVSTVAGISSDVTAVKNNATDISTVASDIANINAVAGDLTNINNASTYADNANIWAEGSDAQVQALGGVHSSKGWAEVSSQGQVQSNWAETDTTAKSYIQNKPTLGTMAAESASDYTKTSGLATVATSGNYNDLSNKPTIPTVTDTYSATSSEGMSGKAVASAISGKADTNLSNLTSQGQNIANWSSNVTNCITEIPQDIKLELNNGTLTLKAGSKVYVPNGAGVFDVVTINTDITTQGTDDNTQYIMFYYPQGGYIGKTAKSNVVSGPDGSSIGNYGFWYDTTNNIIKRKLGGVFDAGGYSLPFGLSTATSSGIQSIDQVFNGFSYIGSTIFALPGVKGLIPNGRNEDGSLKSRSVTTQSVLTATMAVTGVVGFRENAVGSSNKYIYDEENNQNLNDGAYWNVLTYGNIQMDNGKITSLTVKTPFHAVDYNDSPTISGWSMPSSRYIDLTLGASGAEYTAPANGYVVVSKRGGAADLYLNNWGGSDNVYSVESRSVSAMHSVSISFPVRKGEIFGINYTLTGNTELFRFIYAEGEI